MPVEDVAGRSHVHRLRVRYGECDPQGIVFNANYLAYLDVAFTEFWRPVYGSYDALVQQGLEVVLVHSELAFRQPARADDEIDVTLTITGLGTTSMRFAARITGIAGELLLESTLSYVLVDARTLKGLEMPSEMRAVLSSPG